MLEREIEKRVVRHCHDRNLLAYKFSSPAHRGVPDRLIVGGGKAMFLELKSPGNVPTALQQREIGRLNEKGVYATWCNSYEKAVELIDDFFLPEDLT